MAKRILIVAGEASGDAHAAKLVQDVRKLDPEVEFFGMGGAKMEQVGVNVIWDIKNMSVIGVFDVFLKLPTIWKTMQKLRHFMEEHKPDMLILVDYPGFNLRLAKVAKKLGIKVFYYIAPKLWASRARRIKTIKKYVDQMAVIFPFEVDYFKRLNYPVTFVGNPLSEVAESHMTKAEAKQHFGFTTESRLVGLFPGSRTGEIKKLLPVILESAHKVKQQHPDVQFILPLASSLTTDDIQAYLGEHKELDVTVILGQAYNVMRACDAAIAVSGTVTLEAALMELPIVIIYKVFPPRFPIHWVISIPYIGLCNIVAGKKIVQEYVQQHANANNISTEINKILDDDAYRNNMIAEMQQVKDKLIADKHDLAEMILAN